MWYIGVRCDWFKKSWSNVSSNPRDWITFPLRFDYHTILLLQIKVSLCKNYVLLKFNLFPIYSILYQSFIYKVFITKLSIALQSNTLIATALSALDREECWSFVRKQDSRNTWDVIASSPPTSNKIKMCNYQNIISEWTRAKWKEKVIAPAEPPPSFGFIIICWIIDLIGSL